MALQAADWVRAHGLADADVEHAVRTQQRGIRLNADRTFLIGADPTGRLLELVLLDASDAEPACVVHAKELRPEFYRFL